MKQLRWFGTLIIGIVWIIYPVTATKVMATDPSIESAARVQFKKVINVPEDLEDPEEDDENSAGTKPPSGDHNNDNDSNNNNNDNDHSTDVNYEQRPSGGTHGSGNYNPSTTGSGYNNSPHTSTDHKSSGMLAQLGEQPLNMMLIVLGCIFMGLFINLLRCYKKNKLI